MSLAETTEVGMGKSVKDDFVDAVPESECDRCKDMEDKIYCPFCQSECQSYFEDDDGYEKRQMIYCKKCNLPTVITNGLGATECFNDVKDNFPELVGVDLDAEDDEE